MPLYDFNVDLVNDSVYTRFGYFLCIQSQDIKQKPNSDVNQGPLLCCQRNVDLVNNNVYTTFGLIPSIHCQNN